MKVEIAPNNAERDLSLTPSFTGYTPIVEPHKIEDTEGANRHSHHVPEKQLAVVLKVYYEEIAKALDGQAGMEGLKDACDNRKTTILNDYLPGHGKNLSAILISQHAHKKSENAVHRVNTEAVLSELRSTQGEGVKSFVLYKTNGELYASIRTSQWKLFIKSIYDYHREATGGEKNILDVEEDAGIVKITGGEGSAINDITNHIQTLVNEYGSKDEEQDKKRVKDNLVALIDNTAETTFTEGLRNGIANVTVALRNSDQDGNPDEHKTKISKLEDLATEIWEDNIVAPI